MNDFAGSNRTASCPAGVYSDIGKQLEELRSIRERNQDQEARVAAALAGLREAREGLSSMQDTCHTVVERSSSCLEDYFRRLPPAKLQAQINERFAFFDSDSSGSLDRSETREAMAEMGQRPSDQELDEFFALFDLDGNGQIDQQEFSTMVRVKLGLLSLAELRAKQDNETANKGSGNKDTEGKNSNRRGSAAGKDAAVSAKKPPPSSSLETRELEALDGTG